MHDGCGRRSERRSFFRGISPPGPAGLAIHVGTDTSIHPYIHTSISIYNSIYHSYRILALYMGVCMHGDGSEDPLVPWLHKDCPAGGGGCPHPWPLGSPGEDQGDAFCRRCCMLWHPWMHPWHDGTPQTRADVDGMPKQHWMHAAGACMCANRWHTVCTCAHYAGSSDPSHCPHAPGARELACVVATAGMQALFCRGMCPWAVAGRLTRLSQRLQPTACLQRCKQVLDQTR